MLLFIKQLALGQISIFFFLTRVNGELERRISRIIQMQVNMSKSACARAQTRRYGMMECGSRLKNVDILNQENKGEYKILKEKAIDHLPLSLYCYVSRFNRNGWILVLWNHDTHC